MRGRNVLVSDEDLEGRNKLSERNALVAQPGLVLLRVVEKDDEIICLALEVDLALLCAAASHCE